MKYIFAQDRCKKMMSVKLEEYAKEAVIKFSKKKVEILASKYGFSCEEAMRELNLDESMDKKRSSEVVLPFCGILEESKCSGLKLNHGLYTQCKNDWNTEVNGKNFVKHAQIKQKRIQMDNHRME